MPYTYEKDKNGRWRTSGNAAGSVPMSGGGFGPAKPTPKRKEKPQEHPWWWHVTPQGLGNDLRYEGKRAEQFNKPLPTDRKPTLPIQQLIYALPPVARQVVVGATVRAGSDAALAAVNFGQRALGNANRTLDKAGVTNPVARAIALPAFAPALLPMGLFGPSRDPEATLPGKAILAAGRAATKALGGRLPEEMSPSNRDVYEAIPAGFAANAALAPVEALQLGRAIKGAGVAAKAARWGLNTAANEGAANLLTDNTMGGPSSLLKAVGVPVPDALSADPTRDDRISAGWREIPASMVFAGALGGAAGLLERAPHVARALRENRTAQELSRARQKTVANGLQEPDPTTGGHNFTQTATTPPPPPPPPVAPPPAKPVRSVLEQHAEMLGIAPEVLAAERGVPYNPTSQPAPAAAPAPAAQPRAIPSIEGGDFTTFGKAMPGDLPQADPMVNPWAATTAPEAPAAAAAPAPMAAPEPAAPKAPAAADDMAAPVYDPELPEIDHVALALERLDPAAVEQIAQTPGPVLPRIEEALASRQPVAPRPELTATNVVAPSDKLAENQFLTRRDEWSNLRDDELLGVFHPEVNPGLFGEAYARTGRPFEELTREDAIETLSALADSGATVMPDRLKAGIELARTRDLVADPERFQYKLNTNNKGVQKGNSLEGLERWNTGMENTLLVWEDPATGKTYVVNGHNRLAKALELGIPTLPVRRLLASTPEQARALGAMDNIASGGGTPWDAAKFFRDAGILDMGQAKKAGLPLDSGHAEKGLQLAALPDNIFQAGLTGDLPEARAMALGASGLSPEKMQSVWTKYQDDKFFRTEENFPRLIDLARGTPTTAADSGGRIRQGEIPGFETAAERDLTVVKIKLVNKVKANLATDKRALKGASRNAGTLEAKGNSQIDAQTAMQAGLDAEQLGRVFDAVWWASDNEISALLNAGAEEIAAGAKADVVARRIQGELAQAAEKVMLPKPPEPAAPASVAPEPPMPKTAKDHEANQMLVLNRAAAQNEVRPSATPIPVPPAPPEIDVAKAAKGIDAQDVMGGDSQLKFAQQQRQQALDAGDTKAVEAWDKEIRKVNQGRLGAAMDAQDASQTGLFGVTEYDNSMPLFGQKLDAEEARLAAEYKERDTAMQQEVARAEREAMGYHDMTFEQKKAEAGIAEGWAPAELPPAPEAPQPLRLYRGVPQGRKGGKTVGDALFMTPDRKVAEMYAGEGGSVTEADITFSNMLEAKTWAEAKKTLGLPKSATMDDLVNKARADGFDGVTFETTNGREYISIPAPEPAAPPARAIEIPAAADKKLSKSNVDSVAQSLMNWANAGLPENRWLVKSIDEARALVQAKNRHLWSENIPGIDLDKALNDRAMGKSSQAVEDVSNAYRQFYGVKMPERGADTSIMSISGKAADPGGKGLSPETKDGMRAILTRIIREVAGGEVEIRFNDAYLVDQVPREWGGTPGQMGLVKGYYTPHQAPDFLQDYITINGLGDPRILFEGTETAYHEAWHRIQHVALGENEAKILNSTWARLKIAIGSGHLLDNAKISYGESQAVAVQRYAAARKGGTDPTQYLLAEYAPDSKIGQLALKFFSGVDRVLDFGEKVWNALSGNGFMSTRSILEDFYQGNLIEKYDYSAAPLQTYNENGWFERTWYREKVPKFDRFTDLSSVLRDVDGGKLKGVSKKALDAAEKGDPEQALAEATDYANRRMAEIDTKIEDIKRRAIEEGC